MFTNYHYFLVLAEEGSISRAAERLFVTHQCLSKYISNLETEYGVTLFERKPVFTLTYAGKLMLEAFVLCNDAGVLGAGSGCLRGVGAGPVYGAK